MPVEPTVRRSGLTTAEQAHPTGEGEGRGSVTYSHSRTVQGAPVLALSLSGGWGAVQPFGRTREIGIDTLCT